MYPLRAARLQWRRLEPRPPWSGSAAAARASETRPEAELRSPSLRPSTSIHLSLCPPVSS